MNNQSIQPGIFLLGLVCGLVLHHPVKGQDLKKQYRVINRAISPGADAGSIHLSEVEGVGIAWITDASFTVGDIEFDVKGKDVLQRSFVGLAFHGVNDIIYEAIYFRPFNFKTTDPVRKLHAVQYIASPNYDWPKLREEYPNKYEKPVSPVPDPNEWFHAHISVTAKNISVYVNQNSLPSLVVEKLVQLNGKMIGFWAGNASGGDWKNLKITRAKN